MKNKLLNSIVILSIGVGLYASPLSISKAYQLSLENSNDIASSNYQVQATKEDINQIKSNLYPQISSSISYSNTDYEINHLQRRVDYGINEKSTDYSISLNQTIYNKEIYSKLNSQRIRAQLSNIKLQIQKQDLSKQLLKIYLDILQTKNKIELYNVILQYSKNKADAINKQYKMNLSNKMDLLQAKVDLNSAKITLANQKKSFTINRLKLQHLISKDNFELPSIDFVKINKMKIAKLKAIIQASDISTNLNIQEAKTTIALTKADIDIAKSGYYPNLSFNASYTRYDSDAITTDYEHTTRYNIALKIPIYSGGYTKSKIKSSRLKFKAAKEDLKTIQKDIKIQYDDFMAKFENAVDSLDMYQESLTSANLYVESVSLGVQNGLKSRIDLDDAKSKLFDIKYKYSQNIYDMLNAYVGILIITNNLDKLKLIDEII